MQEFLFRMKNIIYLSLNCVLLSQSNKKTFSDKKSDKIYKEMIMHNGIELLLDRIFPYFSIFVNNDL